MEFCPICKQKFDSHEEWHDHMTKEHRAETLGGTMPLPMGLGGLVGMMMKGSVTESVIAVTDLCLKYKKNPKEVIKLMQEVAKEMSK